MISRSEVIVVFDQISAPEFFHRLEWSFMVKAWCKAIEWRPLAPHKVELKLAGLDGLDRVTIARRRRGNRIFIGASDVAGTLIQSGLWEYDEESRLGICYRRIYRPDLVVMLRERLADFCCATFLKVEQSNV